MIEKLFLILRI